MPWLTIIIWIISFLAAGGLKSGKAGKAALIASGTAAATYFLAEPTNPDAVFGDTTREWLGYSPSDDPSVANASAAQSGASKGQPSLGTSLVTTTGEVLKSWGPTGTVGVVAGTAAVTGSGIFKSIPSWVWIAGGAAFLLTR